MPSGFWEMLKEYPAIVSEGFRLATDTPRMPKLRFDPEGERKAEEKRARSREWAEEKRRSGFPDIRPDTVGEPPPPLKAIHLQYHDAAYDTWHDTTIYINLEDVRIHQCPSWMLGRQHEGSGAIGVMVFAAPVLIPSLPYIWAKNRLTEAQEKRQEMSRHAISVMRELEGKLVPEDEALLRETFKNERTEQERVRAKFSGAPTFEEACRLLDECEMRVHTYLTHRPEDEQRRQHYWIDEDDDIIGRTCSFSDEDGPAVEVKSALFHGEEAEELLKRFKTLNEE